MRQHAALLALIAAAPLLAGAAEARDRALVVGVDRYPRLVAGGRPGAVDLGGAVTDATTMVELLVGTLGFDPADVRLLTDGVATRAAILRSLDEWLIAGSRPGDRVVFYFAGHGATASVAEGTGRRLTSTLVPHDAEGDLDGDRPTVSRMIQGREIRPYLDRLADRRVTVVTDACHSGSVSRGGADGGGEGVRIRTLTPRRPIGLTEESFTPALRAEVKTTTRLIDLEGRPERDGLAVWSATTLGQLAFERVGHPGGVFTQSFVEGLRDRKAAVGSRAVTAGGLFNYVSDASRRFCEASPRQCAALTPQLEAAAAYRNLVLLPDPDAPLAASPAAQAVTDAESLLGHRNDFSLAVGILPGLRIRRGEEVRFRITAGEAGTPVVLDSGPDGRLRQIHPSARCTHSDGRQVRAGVPLTFPNRERGCVMTAKDVGPGTLLVLVAEDGLDLSPVMNRFLDMAPIGNPRGAIVEFAGKLQAPRLTPDPAVPNRAYRWAFTRVRYEVVP